MRLKTKHINLIKIAGFFLLLVAMFVINQHTQSESSRQKQASETVYSIDVNEVGLTALTAQIPHKTEGSLPIKLITSLNSNFLNFVNNGFEFKNEFNYLQLKRNFLKFYRITQRKKLINHLVTAKSKDIQ